MIHVHHYAPFSLNRIAQVRTIYAYYKKYDYKTIVMGASFRNIGEILGLAGCDRLTIAPKFLEALMSSEESVPQILSPSSSPLTCTTEKLHLDESTFRFMLNEDAMATEKLAEGIRGKWVRGLAANLEDLSIR